MFEVGDKVVCIDADFSDARRIDLVVGHLNTYPVEQGIYTIRELTNEVGVGSGILVEEIVNPKYQYSRHGIQEAAFKATRFIKLSDLTEMEEALAEVHQILEMELA